MEGYIKVKVKLTNKMSCEDIIKKYEVGEYDPQDLTISQSGIILTIYKKADEIKELNKYI
ncbi:hypothetical protein EHW71_12925 [Clostridium butyricum]|uniref:hypothetical protein n=1 Tax=Clostridium butyricum TaxID=1492 RepID=UPI000F52FA68|nr:hypothetical protein [Clostridium butyricum]RQN09152.1 hypothetical protein EHW71_12925 [Clostridium butyricum]